MNKWAPIYAVAASLLLMSPAAHAADNLTSHAYWGLGAGLAMGFAVIGGALGQGMAAKGVYESISRNPGASDKLNAPFYVGMAFIESLVLFTFAVAMTLVFTAPQ